MQPMFYPTLDKVLESNSLSGKWSVQEMGWSVSLDGMDSNGGIYTVHGYSPDSLTKAFQVALAQVPAAEAGPGEGLREQPKFFTTA